MQDRIIKFLANTLAQGVVDSFIVCCGIGAWHFFKAGHPLAGGLLSGIVLRGVTWTVRESWK